MYRVEEPFATPLSQAPAENEDFLFGIDLFNAGFYWEAHTCWERLWAVEEGSPEIRRFLQGLIQISAACLKAIQGRKTGARKLLAKADLERFEGIVLGVDAQALAQDTASFVEGEGGPPRIELEAT
jgi:predicted metal-dependent hydrolase